MVLYVLPVLFLAVDTTLKLPILYHVYNPGIRTQDLQTKGKREGKQTKAGAN